MAETHRYVALLRGVNVGGSGSMRMAQLRAQCEAFGLLEVSTYIQSGNVLFASPEGDAAELARRLEEHLAATMGYRGAVFVRSGADLEAALAHNPFARECEGEALQCHLMFLAAAPDGARSEALMARQGAEYRFALWERVLYYVYPRALAAGRRTIDFERILDTTGTARTRNVVAALAARLA